LSEAALVAGTSFGDGFAGALFRKSFLGVLFAAVGGDDWAIPKPTDMAQIKMRAKRVGIVRCKKKSLIMLTLSDTSI
jgi:hypothetical protein